MGKREETVLFVCGAEGGGGGKNVTSAELAVCSCGENRVTEAEKATLHSAKWTERCTGLLQHVYWSTAPSK